MKAGDTAGAARTGGRVSAIPRDVSCGTNRLNVPRSRSAALQGCLSGRWQAERPALREPDEPRPSRTTHGRAERRPPAGRTARRDPRTSAACRRHNDRAARVAGAGARSHRGVRRRRTTRSFRPRPGRPPERRHAFAPRLFDERVEAGGFGFQYRSTECREAVVAAPFVARRAAPRLDDQGAVDQAGQRGVERAGAEPDRARRALGDLENDSVTVAIAIAERQQNLELLG